ncbi:MAG: DUF106 domain-containing protein [Candidatus Micrarchaeota archaeon]|nr:DUF106 domain-containing protein [Candidatus Micrarchaeota archaeon]MDE1834119.1 DUF106 domain-containing protein [Candidatus Micrarchaeota archaeon]MDE1859034.1 DUF106 domain-containing protein [Candidatus Micrarchaeota archaeon]
MDIILVELIVIAIAYVSLSVIVQRKFTNMKRIKEIRLELNKITNDLRKMGNNISKDIMLAKQNEMAALTTELMKHQLKGTLIIFPIGVLLFYVALPHLFSAQTTISVLSFQFTYRTFFIIAAFVLGMISSIAFAVYDKVNAKKMQAPSTVAQQPANSA